MFFERWMSRLPVPLTDADRAAGYWWELSMRQIALPIEQYLKDGRAMRIETVANDAYDLGCQRHLHNLDKLQTKDGLAFAIIYTKVHNRVLRPLLAPTAPTAPRPLRAALRSIGQHVIARLTDARLPTAAA